jgi:hypothetical protein
MTYRLEKTVWTDEDFDQMGWHDAKLWSMLADDEAFEYALDLDYIFEWVHPGPGETYFRFWVAPVTMVFSMAHSVVIDIESHLGSIEVADLHRGEPVPKASGEGSQREYRFECQEGEVRLMAEGYRMYVRRPPVLQHAQSLALAERGGVSFERIVTPIGNPLQGTDDRADQGDL